MRKLALINLSAILIFAMTMATGLRPAQAQATVTPAVNPALVVSFEGIVASTDMGIGQEFPQFTLALPDGRQVTVITGPYYFLLDSGFDIRVGDRMQVEAYYSLWYQDAYIAITLNNLTTGEILNLRDANGSPLWTNRGGPGYGGMGDCHGCSNGDATIFTFEGIVVSVNMGMGLEYPSFVMVLSDSSKITIMVGPYRYLVENNFTITVGDRMRVEAFRSLWPDNVYAAVELNDLTTGVTLTLREDDGSPLWTRNNGQQGSRGNAYGQDGNNRMGDCWGWIPPAGTLNITTLEGIVLSTHMAAGQEFPSFVLSLNGSGDVTILTGPYYLILQSGFDINIGDRMSVKGFPSLWYENTYVAVELNNLTTNDTLILRDGTGQPNWTGSQQFAERGFGYGGGAAYLDINPANLQALKCTIESVNPGIGQAYGSFTAMKGGKRLTFITAPNRFMLEKNFELRANERLKIRAYPSGLFDDIYVIEFIKNRETGRTLTLRNELGRPMWN
ncbi:MAG: hypothetical protein AB1757_09505 [Acidobacteriota bacterium]